MSTRPPTRAGGCLACNIVVKQEPCNQCDAGYFPEKCPQCGGELIIVDTVQAFVHREKE